MKKRIFGVFICMALLAFLLAECAAATDVTGTENTDRAITVEDGDAQFKSY